MFNFNINPVLRKFLIIYICLISGALLSHAQHIQQHAVSHEKLLLKLRSGYEYLELDFNTEISNYDTSSLIDFLPIFAKHGVFAVEKTFNPALTDQKGLYQINFTTGGDVPALINDLVKLQFVEYVDEFYYSGIEIFPNSSDSTIYFRADECDNLDFEYGDFTNWEGFTGRCCGAGINNPGLIDGRHTIISQQGTDANTNNDIDYMPFGSGNYSARLGNDNVGYQAERMRKTFQVTKEKPSIVYQYAVVLQDPSGHSQNNKPKFEIRIFDSTGTVIPGPCGYYQVTAGPATDDWKKNGNVRYKDWATIGVDLSDFIGQTLTIEFLTEDCGLGGHYGYAYLDVTCGDLEILVYGYCPSSDSVTLTAPDGFVEYYWPSTGETTKSIKIALPAVNDSVTVELINEASCPTKLHHIFEPFVAPNTELLVNDTTICLLDTFRLLAKEHDKLNYSWTSIPPGFTSDEPSPLIQPDSTRTYKLETSSIYGCPERDSAKFVTVTVLDSLRFELGEDRTICQEDTISIFPDQIPPGSFVWSSNPAAVSGSADTINVNPDSITTYILTATNSTCEFTDSITIDIHKVGPEKPDTLIYYCIGTDSLQLALPAGNLIKHWDSGSTDVPLTVKNPVDGTKLAAFVTSPLGCADTINYQLIEKPNPVLLPYPDTSICEYRALPIGGGTGNLYDQYTWTSSPPGFNSTRSTPVVSPDDTTVYFVKVTSKEGCIGPESMDTIKVDVIPSPEFDLGAKKLICPGDSITLVPSEFFTGTYNWTANGNVISGDSVVVVSPVVKTNYYLDVVSKGCSFTDWVTVDFYPLFGKDADIVGFCKDATSVTVNAPSGSDYIWSVPGETTKSIDVNNPVDGATYSVSYKTIHACKDTASYRLYEIAYPVASVGAGGEICQGEKTTLNGSGAGINGTYSWTSDPAGFNSGSQYPQFSPAQTTEFILQITDRNGCTGPVSWDTVTVKVEIPPAIDIGPDQTICPGDQVALGASLPAGSYKWTSSPIGFSSFSKSVTVDPETNTTYQVTLTTTNCVVTDKVNISLYPMPVFTDNERIGFCPNTNLVLTAPDGFVQHDWPVNSSNNKSITVFADNSVNEVRVPVYLTTSDGCRDTAHFIPHAVSISVAAYSVNTISCEGDQVQLKVFGPVNTSYQWISQPAGFSSTSASPVDYPVKTTRYIVTADSAGCTATSSVLIQVNQYPVVDIDKDFVFCTGDSVLLDPGPVGDKYLWNTKDTTQSIYVTAGGNYTVNVIKDGCTTMSNSIWVEEREGYVDFKYPNVFTPNGDGINEEIYIGNLTQVTGYHATIYNRWGRLMFESTDPNIRWDGTNKGRPVDEGVYYWIVRYRSDCLGFEEAIAGHIQILR